MKTVVLATSFGIASAFAPAKNVESSIRLSETKADLEEMGPKLNPLVKYWDPLSLAEGDFYDMGEEATVGFLRHSEIKHGRVAMAAFVGYCVQSNFIFPWPQHLDGTTGPSADLLPEQQWDAIPEAAKWQIFTLIGFLEIWDECSNTQGIPHYTKGRKPGQYPSLQPFRDNVHFALDLYDPFGFSKNRSEEAKARGRLAEINNGRLAMLGIFGFLSADKIEGSVPAIKGIAQHYDGNCMIPFEGNFHL
mmetsp:Transcript_29963/g.45427  ORF Transcript_29963/g.45427 Transcript_29963/m.45427 type:complete len:248 (+) Transcript_29963:99-842(+)